MHDANQIVIQAIEETREGLGRRAKQLIIGKGVSFDELEGILFDYRSLLTEASEFPDLRSKIGKEALTSLTQLRIKARSVILSEMKRLKALEEKLASPFADLFSLQEDSRVSLGYDENGIITRKEIGEMLGIGPGGVIALFSRHPQLGVEGTSGTTKGKFIEHISTRQGKKNYTPERISEILSNFGIAYEPKETASKLQHGTQTAQSEAGAGNILHPNQIAEILGIEPMSVYAVFRTHPDLKVDEKCMTTSDKLRQYVSSKTRRYTPERKARALAEIRKHELAKPAQPEPEHKIIGDTIDIKTGAWLLQSNHNAVRTLFSRHGWKKDGEYGVGKEVLAKYLATASRRISYERKTRALGEMGYKGGLDDIRHMLGVEPATQRKTKDVVAGNAVKTTAETPTMQSQLILPEHTTTGVAPTQTTTPIKPIGLEQHSGIRLPESTKTTRPQHLDPKAAATIFKSGTITGQEMTRIFEARGWKKDGVYSVETAEFARWLANPLTFSQDRQAALGRLGYHGKIEYIWEELGIQLPGTLYRRRCYGAEEVKELFPGLDMQDLTAQAKKRGGYERNRIAGWVIASAIEKLPNPPSVRITDAPDKNDTNHPPAKNYCDTMEKLIGQAGLLPDPTAKILSDRMEGTVRYLAGQNPCGREFEFIRDLYEAARSVAAAGLVDELCEAMDKTLANENRAYSMLVISAVKAMSAANKRTELRAYLDSVRQGLNGQQLETISKHYLV